MKKEAKLLLQKATDSLLLSTEHFNRPWQRGRTEAVLIFLDHSFEMLLKSAILHRGGAIRESHAKHTIGFDQCVRKGLTDGTIRFLSEEQALTLQTINGYRDAAQHHLLELSEKFLYTTAQAGVTLFRDLYGSVFQLDLREEVPERVLLLSVEPPSDLGTLIQGEIQHIESLLAPGTRRRIEARARLRALAILESTIQGETSQPTKTDLDRLGRKVQEQIGWERLFPGVAALDLSTTGLGPSLGLRITKKEGVPIQLVQEGTPGARVVAVKRVNELDYYNLTAAQLASHLNLTRPKAIAAIRAAEIQSDPEYFKEIALGKVKCKRYSQKAIPKLQELLSEHQIEDIWESFKPGS